MTEGNMGLIETVKGNKGFWCLVNSLQAKRKVKSAESTYRIIKANLNAMSKEQMQMIAEKPMPEWIEAFSGKSLKEKDFPK